MSAIVTVEEAQHRLKELIAGLAPGDEIVITQNQERVAKLIGERTTRPARPAPGLGKGSILYMAPDFDDPLNECWGYAG